MSNNAIPAASQKNTSQILVDQSATTFTTNSSNGVMYADVVLPLAVGDYVELIVVNTNADVKEGTAQSWFQLYLLGD